MDASAGYPEVQHQAGLDVSSSVFAFYRIFVFVLCGSQEKKKCPTAYCATIKIVFSNVCNTTAIQSAGIQRLSV